MTWLLRLSSALETTSRWPSFLRATAGYLFSVLMSCSLILAGCVAFLNVRSIDGIIRLYFYAFTQVFLYSIPVFVICFISSEYYKIRNIGFFFFFGAANGILMSYLLFQRARHVFETPYNSSDFLFSILPVVGCIFGLLSASVYWLVSGRFAGSTRDGELPDPLDRKIY
ncbi:hypothetical protein [Roseibium sp.]|uniref:hypothetical protein n=1 Tax=Roseibium sp. TaxID=1936156 RepID=UPI003B50AFB9